MKSVNQNHEGEQEEWKIGKLEEWKDGKLEGWQLPTADFLSLLSILIKIPV